MIGDYGIEPWKGQCDPGTCFCPPPSSCAGIRVEKPVKRATVYASALGNYELYLNGRQVGDAHFTPGWTDYKIRVYYNTFDVTDQVKKGFNTIGGILADGWYSGHIGWMHIRDHYGENPVFGPTTRRIRRRQLRDDRTDQIWKPPRGRSSKAISSWARLTTPARSSPAGARPSSTTPLATVDVTETFPQDRGLSGRPGA